METTKPTPTSQGGRPRATSAQKMGERATLAITEYEDKALRVVARHRKLILFNVATSPKQGFQSATPAHQAPRGTALLRIMSLAQVVAEYEQLKADGKAA